MFPFDYPWSIGAGGGGPNILVMGGQSEQDSNAEYPSPGQQREPVKKAAMHRRALVPFTLAPAQQNGTHETLGRDWGFNQTLRPITPTQTITIVYEQWDLMANQNPYAIEPVLLPLPPYFCQPSGIG